MILAVIAPLCWAVNIYSLIILAVVILSWFPSPQGTVATVFRALSALTEPVLMPLRRLIPPVGGMLDLSPMIVLLVLQLVIHPLVCT